MDLEKPNVKLCASVALIVVGTAIASNGACVLCAHLWRDTPCSDIQETPESGVARAERNRLCGWSFHFFFTGEGTGLQLLLVEECRFSTCLPNPKLSPNPNPSPNPGEAPCGDVGLEPVFRPMARAHTGGDGCMSDVKGVHTAVCRLPPSCVQKGEAFGRTRAE